MLLVLCVDLDDDLGRKTGVETPVVGRTAVRDAAVALATADPEDSDVNVLFEGLHIASDITDERVTVAAVAGVNGREVKANRAVGDQIDRVLAGLTTGEDVRAVVVTDGAQDESVLPAVRSRVPVDGVRRVVVRQAQDLESMYYTIRQVINDPETRGTVLVPLGILLLIYPLAILANALDLPGTVFGLVSGLLGLYVLGRGLGLGARVDQAVERTRRALFTGRITLITYLVAAALLVVGGVSGLRAIETETTNPAVGELIAALVFGAVQWIAAAGVTSSLGRVTQEYLAGRFQWRYLNAPFYVLSIAVVLHGLSAFFVGRVRLEYLAITLTAGTLLGLASTLSFAIADAWTEGDEDGRAEAA
jgi:Predicted membrane protein